MTGYDHFENYNNIRMTTRDYSYEDYYNNYLQGENMLVKIQFMIRCIDFHLTLTVAQHNLFYTHTNAEIVNMVTILESELYSNVQVPVEWEFVPLAQYYDLLFNADGREIDSEELVKFANEFSQRLENVKVIIDSTGNYIIGGDDWKQTLQRFMPGVLIEFRTVSKVYELIVTIFMYKIFAYFRLLPYNIILDI